MKDIPYLCKNRKWYIYLLGIMFGVFLVVEAGLALRVSMPPMYLVFSLTRLIFGLLFGAHCVQLWTKRELTSWVWIRITYRLNSARYAWINETPFKLWLIIGSILTTVAIVLKFPLIGICLIISLWLVGLGLELLNSCVEKLCDLVNPEYSNSVKIIKDAFGSAPAFCHSAVCITWIILLIRSLL